VKNLDIWRGQFDGGGAMMGAWCNNTAGRPEDAVKSCRARPTVFGGSPLEAVITVLCRLIRLAGGA